MIEELNEMCQSVGLECERKSQINGLEDSAEYRIQTTKINMKLLEIVNFCRDNPDIITELNRAIKESAEG